MRNRISHPRLSGRLPSRTGTHAAARAAALAWLAEPGNVDSDAVRDAEVRAWNAALATGDPEVIARVRDECLKRDSLRIMTEDSYQARTH